MSCCAVHILTIPRVGAPHAPHASHAPQVTDDLDRRCLMSVLRQYITPRVLDDAYRITPVSGRYYAPPDGTLDSYRCVCQKGQC